MGLFGNFWDSSKPKRFNMKPNEVKICKDCKYFSKPDNYRRWGNELQCHHPNNQSVDLVTGVSRVVESCYELRLDKDLCGPKGNWFEPKNGEKLDG